MAAAKVTPLKLPLYNFYRGRIAAIEFVNYTILRSGKCRYYLLLLSDMEQLVAFD
jgi:hypothetical protein